MKVFILFHEYTDEDHDDVKLLGVFSTHQNAEETLKKYTKLPGFRVWPDGFTIDEYTVDRSHWTEGFSYPDQQNKQLISGGAAITGCFVKQAESVSVKEEFAMTVFLLTHEYTDEDHDDSKFIGVFSTRQKAEEALAKYLKLPGFRVWPDGFVIAEWALDEPSWTEGFSYPDRDNNEPISN